MAADCQWPSGLGPDQSVFTSRSMSNARPRRSSSICAPCSTSTVYARPSSLRCVELPVTSAGLVRISAATATPTGVCARRMARSLSPTRTGLAERARLRARGQGLRAHSLYYDLAVLPLLPLYRRLGVEYDCSYQMPPPGRFTSVPEAARDRGNPDLLCRPFRCHDWRDRHFLAARGPGTGARTPLIYLLMAVSARRLSTATVGEVNVHWRSVAKWM